MNLEQAQNLVAGHDRMDLKRRRKGWSAKVGVQYAGKRYWGKATADDGDNALIQAKDDLLNALLGVSCG